MAALEALVAGVGAGKQAAARFVDPVMKERLFPPAGWGLPLVKMGLVVVGLVLLILAAARPMLGEAAAAEMAMAVESHRLIGTRWEISGPDSDRPAGYDRQR